jgi:hypothetical protein
VAETPAGTLELDLEARVALAIADRRADLLAVVRRCVDAELAQLVDLELGLVAGNGNGHAPANGNGHTNGNGNGNGSHADAEAAVAAIVKPARRKRRGRPVRPADGKPCARCGNEPRRPGQTWCTTCKREHDREYRQRRAEAARSSSRGASRPADADGDPRPARDDLEPHGPSHELDAPPAPVDELDLDPPAPISAVLSVSEAVRLYGPAPRKHAAFACGRLIFDPSTSARKWCELDPEHDGRCSPIAPAQRTSRRPRSAGELDPTRAVALPA